MWEWRCFIHASENNLITDIFQKFSSFLANSPEEHRMDNYYNLNKIEFGLKERRSETRGNVAKVELKILRETLSWGAQYWVKPIEEKMEAQKFNAELISTKIIKKILKSTGYFKNKKANHFRIDVNDILPTHSEIQIIPIEKWRRNVSLAVLKKENFPKILKNTYFSENDSTIVFEVTRVLTKNQNWWTFAFESENVDQVKHFYQIFWEQIPLRYVHSYPEFLNRVMSFTEEHIEKQPKKSWFKRLFSKTHEESISNAEQ